jgi:O-antigen/teichoic acid export membrane protein
VKFVKVSLADTFHHLPEMSILFIPTIAISLYNYMDKIMVGAISGSQQLGFYEMAEKIPAIAIAVMGSVGTVMMPRMSNLVAKGDYEKGKKYINTSMQFVMWLSIAMAFGIAGVAKVFAPVYWGIAFSQCAEILMLLVIILPIKGFANVVRTQYLIPSKKDRQYVISVVSGAAVNLVVNFLLIPSLQSIGAALGTIAAEFTVCFVQAYACRKELPIIDYVKSSFPFLIIGAGMCFAVSLIGANHANTIGTLLLQIICGGALYVLLTGIWLYATKNVLLINILKAWKRKD